MRIRKGAYSEIDARVIGAPENVVINDNKVPRNGVTFVDNVLINTFHFVDGDGKS